MTPETDTVLPRFFVIVVASLYVVIGFDSKAVPLWPYWIWPPLFIAIALGIVHLSFRPDLFKLRIVTAMAAAAGCLRGLAYLLGQHRAGPMAGWLLISMLSMAYYMARRQYLPEHYEKHDDK